MSWLEAKHSSSLCKKTTGLDLPHSDLQWKLNPWEFHDHFSCVAEAYSLNMLSRKNFVTNFFQRWWHYFNANELWQLELAIYMANWNKFRIVFSSLPQVMGPEWLFQFWTPCYNKFWLVMTSSTGDEVFLITQSTNYRFLQRNQNDHQIPTGVIFFTYDPYLSWCTAEQSYNNVVIP